MNDELVDVFKRRPFVYKTRKLYCLLYSSVCACQAALSRNKPDSAQLLGLVIAVFIVSGVRSCFAVRHVQSFVTAMPTVRY